MFVFVAFAVVGGSLAAYGVRLLIRTRSFLRTAVRTEGEIVGWRREMYRVSDPRRDTLYPKLRFRAPDGRIVETEADVGLEHPADPEGPVTVLFDPEHPEHARLATIGGRGYTEALLFLVGGALLAVGPYLLSRM